MRLYKLGQRRGIGRLRALACLMAISALVVALLPAQGYGLGTASMLKDISAGATSPNPGLFTAVGDTTFFTAEDPINGPSLWKTDGTEAGTVLVKDLSPNGDAGGPRSLTNVNGTLYFNVIQNDLVGLWKSDGTGAGTMRFKVMNAEELVAVNDTLFFSGNEIGDPDRRLWKTDGTEAGTELVENIQPDSLTAAGDMLYFAGYHQVLGRELWKSDGTALGTSAVTDLNPGSGDGFLDTILPIGSTVYFRGTDGTVVGNSQQRGLWKTDGTEAGTEQLKSGEFANFTNLNGTLYVTGYPDFDFHGLERGLWKSDGTPAGTVFVKNFSSMPGGEGEFIADMGPMKAFNNQLLIAAGDSGPQSSGVELWKSDGTTAGTTLLADINPGTSDSRPSGFTQIGDDMYFNANDGTHGFELWGTDGTTADTALVQDIWPDSDSSNPGGLAASNGVLYFAANDGTHGFEPWTVTAPEPDTIPPVISDVALSTNPISVGQNTTLTAAVSDENSGVSSVTYRVNGGAAQALTFNAGSGVWQASFGSTLPAGSHAITVAAADNAGNQSAPANVQLNITGAGVSQATTNGVRRFAPSANNGDVLPGLATSGPLDRAAYNFAVSYNGSGINPASSFSFTYNTGALCQIFPNNPNCHTFSVTATSFMNLSFDSQNNSHASFRGTASVVVDGTTTTNPFVVEATDGNRVGPSVQDQFILRIYAPDADPLTATPLYKTTVSVPRSQVTIQ